MCSHFSRCRLERQDTATSLFYQPAVREMEIVPRIASLLPFHLPLEDDETKRSRGAESAQQTQDQANARA